MEDPKTGDPIDGPLIVGLALLHDPHLGQSASLYSAVKPYERNSDHNEVNKMTTEKVEVPVGLFEKIGDFLDNFSAKKEEEPEEQRDDFEAIQAERDDYKSKFDALVAEQEKAKTLAEIRAKFNTDEHGEAFANLAEDETTAEMLAGMTEEQREWTLEKLGGLSAQAYRS